MGNPDPNVLVIGGDKKSLPVTVCGEAFTLRPMPVPAIEAFVREGGIALFKASFAGESASLDWENLIGESGPVLRRVIAIATEVPQDLVDRLDAEDLIRLATAALELNLDFFVRRARPALGGLLMTMTQIARSASPRTSQTASRH
jgi:hypothetical protein